MVAAKVQGVGISIISDFFKSMIRPNQAAAFRQRPNDSRVLVTQYAIICVQSPAHSNSQAKSTAPTLTPVIKQYQHKHSDGISYSDSRLLHRSKRLYDGTQRCQTQSFEVVRRWTLAHTATVSRCSSRLQAVL